MAWGIWGVGGTIICTWLFAVFPFSSVYLYSLSFTLSQAGRRMRVFFTAPALIFWLWLLLLLLLDSCILCLLLPGYLGRPPRFRELAICCHYHGDGVIMSQSNRGRSGYRGLGLALTSSSPPTSSLHACFHAGLAFRQLRRRPEPGDWKNGRWAKSMLQECVGWIGGGFHGVHLGMLSAVRLLWGGLCCRVAWG